MRLVSLFILVAALTACAATHLERNAGAAAKTDCRDQARQYVQLNIQNIDPAWRQYAQYEQYQECLARRVNSNS